MLVDPRILALGKGDVVHVARDHKAQQQLSFRDYGLEMRS